MIFRLTKSVSSEEYDRWKNYIESKDKTAIVIPEYIDVYDDGFDLLNEEE